MVAETDAASAEGPESQVCSARARSKATSFQWSVGEDGTGVAVYVNGVPQVVIMPDAESRRFHAKFAESTGLNGSPVARAQMNALVRKTSDESAVEMGRLLKEARKNYGNSKKGNGWRLSVHSDHGQFA